MSARMAYHWDDQVCLWQIQSRSGHVVCESPSLGEVKAMLAQIARVPVGVRPAGSPDLSVPKTVQTEDPPQGQPPTFTRRGLDALMPGWCLVSAGVVLLAFGTWLLTSDWPALASDRAAAVPPRWVSTPPPATTMQFQFEKVRVARPVWQTTYQPKLTKVMVPVWETQEQEEKYTVTRPVVETSVRYEKYVVSQPVTTYATHYADQGRWEEHAPAPTPTHTSLKWVSGGWTTDAMTGLIYWRMPGLRPVKTAAAATARAHKVWKPNIVPVSVPQTVYKPKVETRAVPVEHVRFVEEQRTRKVPVRVCRMVEQEVMQNVPVVTCRMVFEERLERVPVTICRRGSAAGANGQVRSSDPEARRADASPLEPERPQPKAPSHDLPKERSMPEFEGPVVVAQAQQARS